MQIFLLSVLFLMTLYMLIYISNNIIKIKKYKINNMKIPTEFNGYKILHISDVHSKIYGEDNEILLKKVSEINPDCIMMTGDIIDKREKDIEGFVKMYHKLYSKFPTYYAIGNHERQLGYENYRRYIELLKSENVKVMRNGSTKIEKNGEKLNLFSLKFRGNMQPKYLTIAKREEFVKYMKEKLGEINKKEYNILLSHDPENFEMYEELKIDLVLSGHLHGGLIRPFGITVFSPRRKFFPKYAYGRKKLNDTEIIISAGLGKASIPIRLFNRPELVEITLNRK